jgi:hypothetical protein
VTAEQTRKEREIAHGLLPLSRKMTEQGAKSLTANEAHQYIDLLNQLCDLQTARAAAQDKKAAQGEQK